MHVVPYYLGPTHWLDISKKAAAGMMPWRVGTRGSATGLSGVTTICREGEVGVSRTVSCGERACDLIFSELDSVYEPIGVLNVGILTGNL